MTCLNLGSGIYTIPGFDNLDATGGWWFESGLGRYDDESVDGITIAHALMYVAAADWPYVFSEFFRVLKPDGHGIVRITEDSTDDPASERYGGYPGAVTLTSAKVLDEALCDAGFAVARCGPTESCFRDRSLIQTLHGPPPKVVHMEGIKW